jgi:hypothetical protein
MIKSIDYYFRISEKANMAHDEDNNPCECYLKLDFGLKKPISEKELEEERSKNGEKALYGAAHLLKINKSFLKLISEQEYIDNTEQ